MYISCPKCSANFRIKEEQIGKKGKKVKCTKCMHIWHQEPLKLEKKKKKEPLVSAPEFIEPLIEKRHLPVVIPTAKKIYPKGIIFLMLGFILFLMLSIFPGAIKIDSWFSDKNIVIRDIAIEKNHEEGKIIVSYKIYNKSGKTKQVPLVRVRLFNANNKVLKSMIEDQRQLNIMPNKYIKVYTEFYPSPAKTNRVDVMIGNRLDFLVN